MFNIMKKGIEHENTCYRVHGFYRAKSYAHVAEAVWKGGDTYS